jgi:hypothetical protein
MFLLTIISPWSVVTVSKMVPDITLYELQADVPDYSQK